MSRLQKKCFIASAATHALLLALLFLAPAFVTSKKNESEMLPILSLVPGRLVDEPGTGGGNPNVKTLPPKVAEPLPVPPQPKTEELPKVVVTPPKQTPKPEPIHEKPSPKIREPLPEKPNAKEATPTEKPKKPLIEPDFSVFSPDARAKEKARTEARKLAQARAAREEYLKRLGDIRENLHRSLSGGASIEYPGPGGEAFMNYGWAVVKLFDEAWNPVDVADTEATTKAAVTILRDGTVKSAKITLPSGNAALDQSVQRALDRVKKVPAFPPGAKDKERTFNINFNLKSRRQTG